MLGTRALILTIVGGAVTFVTMGLLTIFGPAPVVHAAPGCPVGQVIGVGLLCEPVIATAPPLPPCPPGKTLSGLLCVDDPTTTPPVAALAPVVPPRVTPVMVRPHRRIAVAPVMQRSPLVVPRRLAPVVTASVPASVRVVPPMVVAAPQVQVTPVDTPVAVLAPVTEPVAVDAPTSSDCPSQRPRPVVDIEVEVVQS